ncbi:hypothetical protein Q5O89_02995 [Peribacillus frigoritolerans]|nr:hypothetical protein [Peribacillus frigoritolerans]
MESHTIKGVERVGNIEIYFEYDRIDDSLPTLVLLHGFLSSSFSFRKLVPYLIKEYNVISIDLPPFGQSGKDYRYTYSFRNIAKSVVLFLEEKPSINSVSSDTPWAGRFPCSSSNHILILSTMPFCLPVQAISPAIRKK